MAPITKIGWFVFFIIVGIAAGHMTFNNLHDMWYGVSCINLALAIVFSITFGLAAWVMYVQKMVSKWPIAVVFLLGAAMFPDHTPMIVFGPLCVVTDASYVPGI